MVIKKNNNLATSVTESDRQTFITSGAKNASLIVRASDDSSAQVLKYLVEIQNPVLNVSIWTNPANTNNIIHDGSEKIFNFI